MKIIGKTVTGYIVEATVNELLNAGGYSDSAFYGREPIPGADEHNRGFVIGADIKVTATFKYLDKLRANEDALVKAASMLSSLHDFVKAGLPSTIIPPEPSDETTNS